MENDLADLEETVSSSTRTAEPSRPRLSASEREKLRDEACARYEAGQYLTFDEFVAKHEKK